MSPAISPLQTLSWNAKLGTNHVDDRGSTGGRDGETQVTCATEIGGARNQLRNECTTEYNSKSNQVPWKRIGERGPVLENLLCECLKLPTWKGRKTKEARDRGGLNYLGGKPSQYPQRS